MSRYIPILSNVDHGKLFHDANFFYFFEKP